MKALYFDVETTGLDPVKNDVIQLAMIVEVDGLVVGELELKIQPHDYDNIDQAALDVHGITLEEIKTFLPPKEAHKQIVVFWEKFIKKFDKTDKFTPIGYNGRFDLDFLSQFFIKCGDKYFGSWQNWRLVDPLAIIYFLVFLGKLQLPDYKLATLCQHYEIELQAHDALSDIRATRELLSKLRSKPKEATNAKTV